MTSWLLKLVTGNPVVLLWIVGGAFAAGVVTGGGGAWTVQGWRLDKVTAEFSAFVAETKVLGAQAKAVAEAKDRENQQNKEKADAKLNDEVKKIASDWAADRAERDRLRKQLADSRSRPVSKVTTGSNLSCDQVSRDAISAAVSDYIGSARRALGECRSAAIDFRDAVAKQLEQAESNSAALMCGVEWAASLGK